MNCTLDHLVVAARSLSEGVEYVARTLGAAPEPGGEHSRMGTHNALLSLGPDAYLEIIAIDPNADKPDLPRWFGLDDFRGPPRLVHWVARTDRIDQVCGPDQFAEPMQRGDLGWRFALTKHGRLPLGGALPAIIQWDRGGHPCNRLHDVGLRLKRLVVAHADAHRLQGELARLGLAESVTVAHNGPPLKALFHAAGKVIELV